MTGSSPQQNTLVFEPPRRYITFLWVILAWVQAGLLFLWSIPWYRYELLDARSWAIWGAFDLFLFVGATHATMFRVRVDEGGMVFLNWNFHWRRWEWDEVFRLECRSSALGPRYRVRSGRGAFAFTGIALSGAGRLARIIVERADLDDLGETGMSLQSGTLHIWLHPSADEDP